MANEQVEWLDSHGCKGRALVFPQQFMLEMVKHHEPDLLADNFTTKMFTTKEDAMKWLTSLDN